MKKLLLLIFLFISAFSFAQQNTRGAFHINKTATSATLTTITASPNPFNINTRITFNSSKNQLIEFSVKSLLGKTVYHEQVNAKEGFNTIPFERNNITKGMYIYTLQSEAEIVSKRLVIK
ncbi:T9SS type A sorting domain-containing protein [Lutibacter holmesii]|uniref:T9SS type A sorting domain-containing protein n=1 Tax=Lutibacter holmesii TaxID=1137985 RepID=A0ABW3WPM4_9FLAO